MPRPRPVFVERNVSRLGVTRWYFRLQHGKRIRLPDFGTPEFADAYAAALAGRPIKQRLNETTVNAASLAWLIARYRETQEWAALSNSTRKSRGLVFRKLENEATGKQPAAAMTESHFRDALNRRTPGAARNFHGALRSLYVWAKTAKHVATDPTADVACPQLKKSGGHTPWTEADAEKYRARYPLGTKQRVWFDVLVYTGGRIGDAVALGPEHLRQVEIDGEIVSALVFQTEKSQRQVEVTVPVTPELAASIAAGPCGASTFICGERGGSLAKHSFSYMFIAAAEAAGIVGKSAHGIRKLRATGLAYDGASTKELNAAMGWRGSEMAELYTDKAERARLSLGLHKRALAKRAAAAVEQPGVIPLRRARAAGKAAGPAAG